MIASPLRSREIRLRARPEGTPQLEDFALAEASAATPKSGEVQVRNLWMSVDPYMRGRMTVCKSYIPSFELDAPLEGGAIGEVVASGSAAFAPGDLVQSSLGGGRPSPPQHKAFASSRTLACPRKPIWAWRVSRD